jgi:hypothetical protein
MAEKTKLEKWLASLTPEQRAAFDNEDFKKWLTPEKQEKYGVRLPVPAAEPVDPSMLDRLIEFHTGQITWLLKKDCTECPKALKGS